MENTVSAFIACALMGEFYVYVYVQDSMFEGDIFLYIYLHIYKNTSLDGKVDGIQWKYSHQLSNSRNGNSATELFDLKKYTSATQGYDKIQ